MEHVRCFDADEEVGSLVTLDDGLPDVFPQAPVRAAVGRLRVFGGWVLVNEADQGRRGGIYGRWKYDRLNQFHVFGTDQLHACDGHGGIRFVHQPVVAHGEYGFAFTRTADGAASPPADRGRSR